MLAMDHLLFFQLLHLQEEDLAEVFILQMEKQVDQVVELLGVQLQVQQEILHQYHRLKEIQEEMLIQLITHQHMEVEEVEQEQQDHLHRQLEALQMEEQVLLIQFLVQQ
jgi:hypothetical protein